MRWRWAKQIGSARGTEEAFLADADEARRFSSQWRPRRIVPGLDISWIFDGPPPSGLERLVAVVATRLNQERATGNRVMIGLAVERGDGMTWSATAARRAVETAVGEDWEVRCVYGSADRRRSPFDELAELMGGHRSIVRAARRSGLVPELRRNWGWGSLTVLLAIAAGTVGALLDTAMSRGHAVGFVAVAIALTAAAAMLAYGVLVPQVAALLGFGRRGKVEAALEGEPRIASIENRFRSELSEALVADRPRVVVVDDLGQLRPRTRSVVLDYLKAPRYRHGEELWIVFERGRRPRARGREGAHQPLNVRDLAAIPSDGAFVRWVGRQQVLSLQEKTALLLSLTRKQPRRTDARLRSRGIAGVGGWWQVDEDSIQRDLESCLAGVEATATLHAFALLALAARAPEPIFVDTASLVRLACRPPERRTTSARLLLEWFPADSRNPEAIRDAMKRVARDLHDLLDDSRASRHSGSLRVSTPYADAMCAHEMWSRADYSLPKQDLGYAFWALYSHEQLLENRSARGIERISAHLRAIGEPAQFRARHGAEVADALVDVSLDAIEGSIALGVDGLVVDSQPSSDEDWDTLPGLFEQTQALLASGSPTCEQTQADRLLTLGWTSYMLTAEPAVLDVVRSLRQEDDTGSIGRDPFLRLYAETLPIQDVPLFGGRRDRLDPAVEDHARVRSIWLAAIVRPLLSKGTPEHLAEIFDRQESTLAAVVERTLERVRAGRDEIATALDYLTLNVALLCKVIAPSKDSVQTGSLAALLDEARVIALQRAELRRSLSMHANFVLDGLLRQFDITMRACGAAGGHDEAPESASSDALRELEHLHVMWHNVECYELADLTSLARYVAASVIDSGEHEEKIEHLLGVDGTEARAIHRLEAELLVAGARVGNNVFTAGVPLATAGNLLQEARLGARLTVELFRYVLYWSVGSYRNERWEDLLAYVLGRPDCVSAMLQIPAEGVALRARNLLECISDMRSPVSLELREVITRRRHEMSGVYRDQLTQELEWFEAYHEGPPDDRQALEEILDRWRERVFGDGPQRFVEMGESERHDYIYNTKCLYAFVLSYLWPRRTPHDGVLQVDAYRLLAGRRQTTPDTSLVYLANRVSERLGGARIQSAEGRRTTGSSRSIVKSNNSFRMILRPSAGDLGAQDRRLERLPHLAMRIQREGIDGAAPHLSPHMNRSIYERLQTYDSEHAPKYLERAQHWRAEDERLHGELLLPHVVTGRFFEVFWHYFERVPELPVDVDRDVLLGAIASTEPEPAGSLTVDAKGLLEPLIFDRDGLPTAVSGAFLCKGHEVCYGTYSDNAHSSGADRSSIDLPAKEHIGGLYWLLIERTAISEPLREIFREQRRRFETS
jgi:hypothetical protein